MSEEKTGIIFDIQRWSLHDGPGIRTNVFLKGCPLNCIWCSNPESQAGYSEVAFFPDKCINALRCLENCPHSAISNSKKGKIDYEVCKKRCYSVGEGYQCTTGCHSQALKLIGEKLTVKEVLYEVLRDKGIYEQSGGGITVTGGEPLYQYEFLIKLLEESKKEGLHTTIETSGYSSFDVIEKILPFLDLMFVDIKLMDSKKHKQYTGVENKLILSNLKKINKYAKTHNLELIIRTPVIPTINDTKEEIFTIIQFIKNELSTVKVYQLLPYHRLGRGKYSDIGMEYELEDLEALSKNDLKPLLDMIKEQNLETSYD